MELPENLRELVDSLGQALVQALATDEQCRALTLRIQEEGFDIALMLEATLALHRRDEESPASATSKPASEEDASGEWSEEDRAFLQKFRISLE